jgi:hypothetical protein
LKAGAGSVRQDSGTAEADAWEHSRTTQGGGSCLRIRAHGEMLGETTLVCSG